MRQLTLLLILAMFSASPMLAQRLSDQGNFFVGTTLGFNVSQSSLEIGSGGDADNTVGPTSLSFDVEPSVGYFVADRFGIGFAVDYSLQTVDLSENEALDSDLLIGPLLRYYIPTGEQTSFFVHMQTGFGNTADVLEVDGESLDAQTTILQGGIGPGFTIFTNDFIGLEVLALYNLIRSSSEAESSEGSIQATSLTNEVDLQVGIQFYLNRASN